MNAIPFETSMDVDLRSESRGELNNLLEVFLGLVRDAVSEENRIRSTAQGQLSVDIKLIGERPSGETSVESSLTQAVVAAVRAFGLKPTYSTQSTDSNIAMLHNIPALTIGVGEEWSRTLPR